MKIIIDIPINSNNVWMRNLVLWWIKRMFSRTLLLKRFIGEIAIVEEIELK